MEISNMRESISIPQLFMMIVLLPYSSAVLFFLAPETEAGAWVAMLFYILGAIFLQIVYISFHKKFPNDTIITYMPKIYGKILGNFIGCLYIVYFAYMSSRIIRDYVELSRLFGLTRTPMMVVALTFVIIAMYDVYCGIEVIGRVVEIVFLLLILSPAVILIMLVLTRGGVREIDIEPIFQEGVWFVIKSGWKLITFPYGETVLFTMIYPFVNENSKKIKIVSISAVVFLGITLALNEFFYLITLGLQITKKAAFPLLTAAALVRVGNFITRIEVLVMAMLVIGGVYKTAMFMYGAVLGTSQMLKTKSTRCLVLPFGVIIVFLSKIIAKNYFQHIEIGLEFTPKYIHMPMQIIIPMISLGVIYIKDLLKDSRTSKKSKTETHS